MGKYKKLVERYQKDYNDRIANNMDKLIEAFVMYYGEEYRSVITNTLDNVIISWNTSERISGIYEQIVGFYIIQNRIEYTRQILNRLGFDIDKIQCEAEYGRLFFKAGNVHVYPGMIWNAVNEKDGRNLDGLLGMLYGKTRMFSFDYKNDIIYDFERYTDEGKKELVRLLFGKDEIDQDSLDKINSVIEYMDSIKGEKDKEVCYSDFYIVHKHLDCTRFDKKLLNKIFGFYRPKIIGSYNNKIFDKNLKELVKYENQCGFSNDSFSMPYDAINDTAYKLLKFSILIADDEAFIHELNHAVTSNLIAWCDDSFMLERMGIHINDDSIKDFSSNRLNLEEILNQASSIEITDNFHKLGGMLFDEDYNKYELLGAVEYDYFLPLVNRFYSTYKDVLKKVRITENLGLLYKYADKETFEEFVACVNEAYDLGDMDRNVFTVDGVLSMATEGEIAAADALVEKMRTDAFNEEYLPAGHQAGLTDFGEHTKPKGDVVYVKR